MAASTAESVKTLAKALLNQLLSIMCVLIISTAMVQPFHTVDSTVAYVGLVA